MVRKRNASGKTTFTGKPGALKQSQQLDKCNCGQVIAGFGYMDGLCTCGNYTVVWNVLYLLLGFRV